MSESKTRAEKGSVILEAVIVMPLLLISVLAAGQIAHINLAKKLGAVAAYHSCRAAVRSADAEEAAKKFLSSQFFISKDLTVTKSERTPDGYYHLTLEFKLPLIFPVVNYVISGIMGYDSSGFYVRESNVNSNFITADSDSYPCITLKASSVLPMPYTLSNEEVI